MSVALAERPPWLEVLGVLVGCLLLLVVIARMDANAHQAATDRALTAIAKAQQAKERRYGHIRDAADALPAQVRVAAPPQVPVPEREPMIWLVALGGAGLAMAGTGLRILASG